jgi:hypothetical protein
MGLVYRPARHSALKSKPNSSHRGVPGAPPSLRICFLPLGWDRTNADSLTRHRRKTHPDQHEQRPPSKYCNVT